VTLQNFTRPSGPAVQRTVAFAVRAQPTRVNAVEPGELARIQRSCLPALVLAPPAHADSPPPNWVNHRLTCKGTTVDTYLTPAAFGTRFHVTNSPDVIMPKHVEVTSPGETDPVTTLDVPGFDPHRRDAVQGTYTDPAGLFVTTLRRLYLRRPLSGDVALEAQAALDRWPVVEVLSAPQLGRGVRKDHRSADRHEAPLSFEGKLTRGAT
jgi:hypothetical protein